jgi:glycosyltransferase involved in cell wall biosynthesis
VDDFGLIPVEVMACGRPVVAFAGGGALETVVAGKTGEFFEEQSADALRTALESIDPDAYDSDEIRAHAERWRIERFQSEIVAALNGLATA